MKLCAAELIAFFLVFVKLPLKLKLSHVTYPKGKGFPRFIMRITQLDFINRYNRTSLRTYQ